MQISVRPVHHMTSRVIKGPRMIGETLPAFYCLSSAKHCLYSLGYIRASPRALPGLRTSMAIDRKMSNMSSSFVRTLLTALFIPSLNHFYLIALSHYLTVPNGEFGSLLFSPFYGEGGEKIQWSPEHSFCADVVSLRLMTPHRV